MNRTYWRPNATLTWCLHCLTQKWRWGTRWSQSCRFCPCRRAWTLQCWTFRICRAERTRCRRPRTSFCPAHLLDSPWEIGCASWGFGCGRRLCFSRGNWFLSVEISCFLEILEQFCQRYNQNFMLYVKSSISRYE